MENFLNFYHQSKTGNFYQTLVDYSEISTLAGLIYVFNSQIHFLGRIFWILWIVFMLALGTYWSVYLYYGNQMY